MISKLHASISGGATLSEIQSIVTTHGYSQTSAVATIICGNTTGANLNGTISIDMGYDGDHQNVFTGRIKQIIKNRPEGLATVVAKDTLIDAADFFIVSDTPDDPLSFSNITAQALVGEFLDLAGITAYSSSVPMTFTFGTSEPATFNFISSMDAISGIAGLLAWHVYADGGTVYFTDVKPYFRTGADKNAEYGSGGHSSDQISHIFCNDGSLTLTDLENDGEPLQTGISLIPINETIKTIDRTYSDEGIRNRVIVFGNTSDVHAEASAGNSNLPPGFYKTAVISTTAIQTQDMAQKCADFNLALLNRLSENMTLEVIGDASINPRDFCIVSDDFVGTRLLDTGNTKLRGWFIETVNHTWSKEGFVSKLTLTR